VSGRIREDAIRDIRERANLVEVVSDVVALKRRGRSATGLCPFHAEKTPSFTVSEERGFFHCFGCGEHGDVFTFVMKTQSLPFPEAVRWVAERFGLPVPEEAAGSVARAEPLVAVSAAAAAFFRGMLRGPQGQRARAYLAERGLGADTIERFGLGWAPPAGDALVRHLRVQGIPVDDAVTVGLVLRGRQGGSFYDRFRERVTFPIADPQGRVVAFGGRILPGAAPMPGGDPPPKYLNSPESPLFHKGRTLYGLGLARDAIRRSGRAVVVEGYLDVIALAQAGIGEVVAPLGTALTADQLRVLRRFSERVIACFDGDDAGRRAAARSFPTFLEAGLWGRGVFLPAGDDPDTFVRAHGAEALDRLLQGAVPLVDAYVEQLAGPSRDAVGRRADAAREVARLLRGVREPYERDVLARLAAERLGVREEALRAEGAPAAAAAVPRPAAAFVAPPRRDRAHEAEERIVELLFADPALVARVRADDVLADFEEPAARRTVERLLDAGVDRTALVQELPRELRDRVVRRLLDETADEDRDRMLADCIAAIRDRRARRLRGALLEELRAAEARGDTLAATAAQRRLHQHLTEKTRT
jgi:DNA primase